MKNLNLIKRLWTDSHEKQSPQRFTRYAAMLIMLLTIGVGQMWGAVTLYYQKDMPARNYSASNSASMTQSSVNSNRYSCSVSLQNGSYGFYIKNGNDYYKVNATASTNSDVLLYNYGSSNYGNSNHRVTYKTGAAGYFIFTFDASNNKVNVSPRDGLTVKVAWDVASGHDGNYNLDNYTTLTEEGSTGKYSADIDLTAVKHYMFVQTDNSRYWKAASTLSINGSVSLYDYGTSNYGNSADKVNFTPSAAAKYRFTWNHADKTIKIQRLYNISYQKGDNGTGSTQTDYKVHGTDITLRSSGDFTRTGYNHTAWNTNANGSSGTSYDLGATYSTNNDLTLYPTWTAKTSTITLNNQGATTAGTTEVTATYDAAMPAITPPEKDGYTFGGYWGAPGGSGPQYYNADGSSAATWLNENASYTLFAKWTENLSTVTLTASPSGKGSFTIGGAAATSTTAGVTTTRSVTAEPIPGYSFSSWSITGGATISSTTDNPTTVTGAGAGVAATLTATFAADAVNYTITYGVGTSYTSYGSVSEGHSYASGSSQTSGTEISLSASPATHYKLEGWYTTAACATPVAGAGTNNPYEFTLGANTSVYAKFILKQCTITLNKNGGTTGASSVTASHGSTLPSFTAHSRTGYTLQGYYTDPSAGTKIINADGSLVASTSYADANKKWNNAATALTLYAQWTAKQTTVTLNQQSGSGGTTGVTATYGSAMPSATMPTRLGYTFGGYYTNTGGAGTQYYTSGGASARTWNFEDATKTLYAKWTATTYTITYNLNDGANPGGVATSFTIESALITLPTPSRSGYTFDGWFDNSSFTGSAITTIAAGSTGNKSFWANWSPKNYSITYDPVSAPEGVTYTTTPSNANCDATVDMVFTPTGDNTVIVSVVDGSSNPVAVTNPSANTYRFTMPASNVTVHVSVQSLPMVYVLKTKSGSAYFPDGFTSGGSNTQVKIWAWETSTGGNKNFFTGGSWPGYTAQSKATEYTDAHGNVWWRFIPTNTSYFTRSTPYSLIINYDNGSTTSIYESNANDHYVSDGTKRETCNSSTKTTFTGTVWVVPGGTGSHSATLYYENPSSSKKFCFVEGRFMIYTDKSRETAIYTGANKGDWNLRSTNIRMQYDETNSWYYLHTYCTPNELKSISDIEGYINLNTSTLTSSLTGGSAYYANSSVNLTAADTKINFSTTSGHRPYITSTVTNKYVVLYWDESKLWYEEEPIPAQISSISLSASRVPPMAEITATPNMSVMGTVDQAYCWGVYSDEECTSPVNVSFTSLGSGRVQFTVPQTIGTYYLKLTVRASDACDASIDDEEVQSFNVTTDNMVFFNKTDIPWSGVFVYFLGDGSYWDDNLGSGCNGRDYGKANEMHRIGKSDIYYYEYSGNALGNNDIQYIAFTEYGKPNSEHFAYTNAAYRGDFARGCAPMYVPENWITDRLNNCEYYNRGYWTTYGVSGVARNAGFTLKVFDGFDGGTQLKFVDLSNTDGSNTYRATVNLDKLNYSYAYQLLSCGNKYYGNDGVMNANNSTNWKFEPDKHRCGLNSQASGDYDFIVQCTDGGEVRVSVEYPLVNGDYRLLYNDTCVYQAHAHPSQFIRRNYSDGAKLDTVSMYIRPNKQPTLKIQVCDNASSTPPTWRDSITYDVSGLTYGHGVYNFYLSQEDGKLKINDVRPYTGLYYIRTQQADGGWTGYKTNSDNVMTYTEYAEQKNYGFNYYKAKWIGTTGADVTFTIACDYSESLCDTMVADPGNNPLTEAEARSLPHTASVRFGWNSLTNTLHRAYINGTSIVSDRYLVMIGDEKLKDSEGEPLAISGLNPNEIGFTDLNNWIYRCDVKAVTGAEVQLVGNYDGHTQHFIGTAEKPEEIIGGSSGEEYLMRVTYDFKTNRLMTAWLPDGDAITSNMTLKADMMLIREGQNAATQVYFDEGYKDKTISEIHSIYGVMEFQYSKFANQFPNWSAPHAYEYLMYYISFPFDVKVSEIFGVGVRGENWIIQKYNGAKRAQIGWFAETSTFWETLPGDSTLHAHEGYLLLLDRISFNDPGSNVWTNRPEKVYLYFPSASRTIGTIKDNNEKVIIKIPSHTCKIERPFTPDIDGWSGGELVHSNTDSHWNVFGTPLFQSKAATTVGDSELKYFYSWNYTDNTLRPEVTLAGDTVFKAMHGYMVQFAGDVTFTGAHISASVAVRRMPSNKHYLAELQLVSENGDENATYVELRENANTDFQLNEDMYMMRSSNTVDLYSFAGAYDVAANVLPIDDQLVRVGVDVKRAGTYRFTMPSEFSGTVTLIDNLMGTRTNMALGDHEVYLERGVDNNRFLLEININKMPTAIDGVDGGSLKDGKAHKFIENGQMYILKDGIIYDARGNRVQ